jgi:hypothetical protein
MLRHGSRPKPLPIAINDHEFWKRNPDDDGRRARDYAYMRHWLHCSYEKFLVYLEKREKELGINHNR